MLGRFAALGVDSLDGLETKGIAMIQATQCPDSCEAFARHSGDRGTETGEVRGQYNRCYTPHLAPRSRQTADASIGGQHGRP